MFIWLFNASLIQLGTLKYFKHDKQALVSVFSEK